LVGIGCNGNFIQLAEVQLHYAAAGTLGLVPDTARATAGATRLSCRAVLLQGRRGFVVKEQQLLTPKRRGGVGTPLVVRELHFVHARPEGLNHRPYLPALKLLAGEILYQSHDIQ
jgi:hypothetical protein